MSCFRTPYPARRSLRYAGRPEPERAVVLQDGTMAIMTEAKARSELRAVAFYDYDLATESTVAMS